MATTQLTITIQTEIIEGARKYAEGEHRDLNQLLEVYLNTLADIQRNNELKNKPLTIRHKLEEFPEWIQELILSKEPTSDFEHKNEYQKHLEEKYRL